MAAGGTEAFPDLGKHCHLSECKQLDFLPFKCDGCRNFFCVEHRSYKSHECSNPDHNSRKVLVCDICSMSMEIPQKNNIVRQDEIIELQVLANHQISGDCDPKKKMKPSCGVNRCKEILTFSNRTSCKFCESKFCLKHRFQSDHGCKSDRMVRGVARGSGGGARSFLVRLDSRNGQGCAKMTDGSKSAGSMANGTSVKAY